MKKKALAALCAVWIAFLPSLALAQSASQGSSGSATRNDGTRVLGSDGTNDYKLYVDANGYLHTITENATHDRVAVWTAKTIGLGAADSTTSTFQTDGYRWVWALVRFRQASDGTKLQLAWRTSSTAVQDTTGTWYEFLGGGDRMALTLPTFTKSALQDPTRMYRFLLRDTTAAGNPLQPGAWSGIYVKNVAGATANFDLWFELGK